MNPAHPQHDRREPWLARAQCRDSDPGVVDFYATTRAAQAAALALCEMCPVVRACLLTALRNEDVHGVWGGTPPDVRRRALFVVDDRVRSQCPACGRRRVVTERHRRVQVEATCPDCGLAWRRRRPNKPRTLLQ